jgi:hypothetical protein
MIMRRWLKILVELIYDGPHSHETASWQKTPSHLRRKAPEKQNRGKSGNFIKLETGDQKLVPSNAF